MTAYALHMNDDRGISRWALAALVVLVAHVAIVASAFLDIGSKPQPPDLVPAIAVTLAPVDASSPERQEQDIAVGPAMQQAEETVRELPKQAQDEKIEQPPLPPHPADVTLPQEKPEEVVTPKAQQPPSPETRAPPKTEHTGQFTQASANAYNALVFGHLQRFKRYPSAARGASGTVLVQFTLDRSGKVISSAVTKSSGNAVLDRQAIDILRRANPFPGFPPAKPGIQDSFLAPVSFTR